MMNTNPIKLPKKQMNKPTGDETRLTKNRNQAIELRRQGYTLKRIGQVLGVSTQTAANYVNYCLRELVELTAAATEEYRQLELERLDALQAAIWNQAVSGNLFAIDRCVKLMERRAKLLGLDKPLQHILAGDKNNPLEVEHTYSIDKSLMDRITRLAASSPENETPTVENKLNVNEGIK